MATLKYRASTGKLLMRNGHLCTTCCYDIMVLYRFWVEEGSTVYLWEWQGSGKVPDPVKYLYWRIAPQLSPPTYYPHGDILSDGTMQDMINGIQLAAFPLANSHWFEIQLSSDGTHYPEEPL
jgi:hypothetical protein